jgi:hypothetical protein
MIFGHPTRARAACMDAGMLGYEFRPGDEALFSIWLPPEYPLWRCTFPCYGRAERGWLPIAIRVQHRMPDDETGSDLVHRFRKDYWVEGVPIVVSDGEHGFRLSLPPGYTNPVYYLPHGRAVPVA